MAKTYGQNNRAIFNLTQGHLKSCGFDTTKPGTGKGTGKKAVLQYGFHSLRHTFVSICRESGQVPDAVIEAIVGKSYTKYTHVGSAGICKAIDALPSLSENATIMDAVVMVPVNLLEQMNEQNWREIRDGLLGKSKSS